MSISLNTFQLTSNEIGFLSLNPSTSDLFQALSNNSYIDSQIFSIYLSTSSPSCITIGEIAAEQYSLDEIIYTSYVIDDSNWHVPIQSTHFGSQLDLSNGKVVFTPADSFIYGPVEAVQGIFTELLETGGCELQDFQYLVCACDSIHTYPDLEFKLEGIAIVINKQLLFVNEAEVCRFLVTYHDSELWLVGRPVFFNYYISFDIEIGAIGFGKSITAVAEEVIEEVEKSVVPLTVDEIYMIGYILAGSVVLFCLARATYLISSRCGGSADGGELEEQLVEDHDQLEIAKFRAKKIKEQKGE